MYNRVGSVAIVTSDHLVTQSSRGHQLQQAKDTPAKHLTAASSKSAGAIQYYIDC